MERRQPRIRRRIEIDMLKDTCRKSQENETIPFSRLEEIAGRSVRAGEPGYGSMYTARKELEPEGVFFATVSDRYEDGELIEGGLRRLNHSDVVNQQLTFDTKRLAAYSSRMNRRASGINYDGLSSEDKVGHNTYMTVAQTVIALTSEKMISNIGERVRSGNAPIQTREVLVMLPD